MRFFALKKADRGAHSSTAFCTLLIADFATFVRAQFIVLHLEQLIVAIKLNDGEGWKDDGWAV